MKINVGCGGKKLAGYINVDADVRVSPEVVCRADQLTFCTSGTAEEVRCDAVYEHLFESERSRVLREWSRCLRSGGLVVVNWVPDFDAAVERYMLHRANVYYREACNAGCGPTDEFPHFDLAMMERITSGAAGLHGEQIYQVHKSIFNREKLAEELSQFFIKVVVRCEVYPGERGSAYNLCATGEKA